jgi:hypothetical protein
MSSRFGIPTQKTAVDPWPAQQCLSGLPGPGVLRLFENVLDDATDESAVQTFLAAHGQLLTCLLPPGRGAWCWDRPRLGSELIPDFVLCTHNSTGFEWVMVELESPTERPFTQAGRPVRNLNQALGQIRDWRSWLRRNIAYAESELGFDGLNAESRAVVVIGRRSSIDGRHAIKWRELSDSSTQVMTYDRLMETIQHPPVSNGGPGE